MFINRYRDEFLAKKNVILNELFLKYKNDNTVFVRKTKN